METVSAVPLSQALVGCISKGIVPLSQTLAALIPCHSCESPRRLTPLAYLIHKKIRHGVRLPRIAPTQPSQRALEMGVFGQ